LTHVPARGIDETSGELIQGSVYRTSPPTDATHGQDRADPDGVTTTEVVADPVGQESSTSRRLANGNIKIYQAHIGLGRKAAAFMRPSMVELGWKKAVHWSMV
jgi:hypothetical protein